MTKIPTKPANNALDDEAFPKDNGVYFDSSGTGGAISNRYVAWLDLMGAKSIMGRSLSRAANYIGRIHTAALAAESSDLRVYPVIDGCYMVTERRTTLEAALTSTMERLASVFVHESSNEKRFLVRGGIAAGRVIAGHNLSQCNKELKSHKSYADCLAIGTAIGQAYSAESNAPPYGFWVDITARAFKEGKEHPFTSALWRWWKPKQATGKLKQQVLGTAIEQYFEWAEANRRSLEYPLDRLHEHRDAAREYFTWEPEDE